MTTLSLSLSLLLPYCQWNGKGVMGSMLREGSQRRKMPGMLYLERCEVEIARAALCQPYFSAPLTIGTGRAVRGPQHAVRSL
jgi:hypothetical protein